MSTPFLIYFEVKCSSSSHAVIAKCFHSRSISNDILHVLRLSYRIMKNGNGILFIAYICSVSKHLGISREHIRYNLPICKAEIEKYQEPQEKYWAREVVWAAKEIMRGERIITWSRLSRMTNTRLPNLVACIPYLDEFADEELKEQIVTAIKGEERWKD